MIVRDLDVCLPGCLLPLSCSDSGGLTLAILSVMLGILARAGWPNAWLTGKSRRGSWGSDRGAVDLTAQEKIAHR